MQPGREELAGKLRGGAGFLGGCRSGDVPRREQV